MSTTVIIGKASRAHQPLLTNEIRFWHIDHANPPSCQKGTANLLTMAITNIVTDILLIVFPIPLLWRMTLNKAKYGPLNIHPSIANTLTENCS